MGGKLTSDESEDGTVFLHLLDGERILIGIRDDVQLLAEEVDDLTAQPDGRHRWDALRGYLYGGGWLNGKPVSREAARSIGAEATALLALSFGHVSEQAKMVLERLAAAVAA